MDDTHDESVSRSSLLEFVRSRWRRRMSPVASKACNVHGETRHHTGRSTQFTSFRSSTTVPVGLDSVRTMPPPEYFWERNPIRCLGYLKTERYQNIQDAIDTALLSNKPIFCIHYNPMLHHEIDTSVLTQIFSDGLLVEALETLFICVHWMNDTTKSIPKITFCNEYGACVCEISLFEVSRTRIINAVVEACQNAVPPFVRLLHTEATSRPRELTVLTQHVLSIEEQLGGYDGIVRIQSKRYEIPYNPDRSYLGVSAVVITYDSGHLCISQILRKLLVSQLLQSIICHTNEELVAARLEISRSGSETKVIVMKYQQHQQPEQHRRYSEQRQQQQHIRHLSAAQSYHHIQQSDLRFIPMTHLQALKINAILQNPQQADQAIRFLSPRQVSMLRRRSYNRKNYINVPLAMAWGDVYHNVDGAVDTGVALRDGDEREAGDALDLYRFLGATV